MQVRLTDPDLTEDLLAFLRERISFVAEVTDVDTIEVGIVASLRDDAARFELARSLAQWEAEHPGARAYRVR